MSLGFLDLLDSLLATGAAGWRSTFVASQVEYLVELQQPDGGFPGRLGASDLYYTDFAMRLLALLAPKHAAIGGVAHYLSSLPGEPKQLIDCFNMLNISRLLHQCDYPITLPAASFISCMERSRSLEGGYALPGKAGISAYQSFLAALCYEMLDQPLPDQQQTYAQLATLRCVEGGYGETAAASVGQTNATAAVMALLLIGNTLSQAETITLAAFLAGMQARDGGIRAHAALEEGDLLSTFSCMTALVGINRLDELDLPAAGRFVRALALPQGGFRACLADSEGDIEYMYYGLGSISLLQAYLAALG